MSWKAEFGKGANTCAICDDEDARQEVEAAMHVLARHSDEELARHVRGCGVALRPGEAKFVPTSLWAEVVALVKELRGRG